MTDRTSTTRQARRREQLNKIAQQAGYPTWGKYETDTIKKGQITMKPVFKVTNDEFSRDPVTGTLEQLQETFDQLTEESGWDKVTLRIGYGDKLYDSETGKIVGEKV